MERSKKLGLSSRIKGINMIQEALQTAISEAGPEYLNISIKNVDKVIKEGNASDLLGQTTLVYGKYDGTKLSILRTGTAWDDTSWYNNFIVSYKGNVLYGTEYADADVTDTDLDATVGVSQYKSVFSHIETYWKEWKSIPTNTEFFFEFLMNKPTLTRQYTKLRELIFIGYSEVAGYKENHGKLKTSPKGFFMDDREKFAKTFKVNLPELLFDGKMKDMPKGLNSRSVDFWGEYAEDFKNADSDYNKWVILRSFFLKIPSLYGAQKEEGVVFHLSKDMGNANVLKIVQDDQYDKELRFAIKQKYKMSIEDEDEYWIKVREQATTLVDMIDISKPLPKNLKYLSKLVYKQWEPTFTHTKKTEQNVRDDIQLTAKSMLIRLMPGNNGALLVGKFRVFTNGHKKMFDQALKNNDTLVVALVSNKETKKTLHLRRSMIEAAYPKVEIIETTTGNLLTMINRTSTNINTVFAGTDRVDAYKNQLKRNLDVGVEEIKRGEDDESATKVIAKLKDVKYFKSNTPKAVHKFYKELIKTYELNELYYRKYIKQIKESKC